jgi:hypothetical protein
VPFCGGLDLLQRVGPGIVSYFILYRCLFVAVAIAAGLSVGHIYLNDVGGRMLAVLQAAGGGAFYLTLLTTGNILDTPLTFLTSSILYTVEAATLMLGVLLARCLIARNRRLDYADSSLLSAERFAVMASGFPKGALVDEKAVRAAFHGFGRVHSVALVHDIGDNYDRIARLNDLALTIRQVQFAAENLGRKNDARLL